MRSKFQQLIQASLLVLFAVNVMAATPTNVPILTYHNFDPTRHGIMTISTQKFAEQMKWLKDNGYSVIPLKDLVDYLQGRKSALPDKSVVITADDGKRSVYQYMFPLIKEYHYPVTLFVYPSAISNASYALTWDQLREMKKTGLVDVQDHTYWHPDFNQERKRLAPTEYQQLVHAQLVTSKKIIEDKLGIHVTLLAWPYGIYNKYLEQQAAKAGYVMSFSIDDRAANKAESNMSMPRYMVSEKHNMQTFERMVNGVLK